MMYLICLYIVPSIVCFITQELEPRDERNGHPIGLGLAGMVPGVGLILAGLCLAMLFCKFMIWVKDE